MDDRRINSVHDFTVMVEIIRRHYATRPNRLLLNRAFLEELEKTVDGRKQVTAWFKRFRCVAGSSLEADNKKHEFFNIELEKMCTILKELKRTSG